MSCESMLQRIRLLPDCRLKQLAIAMRRKHTKHHEFGWIADHYHLFALQEFRQKRWSAQHIAQKIEFAKWDRFHRNREYFNEIQTE